MNVQVKHDGVNITNHVISYEREHKICTGIGQLQIVIDAPISRTFKPWDTIDIHENGSFQVRYYVSDVEMSKPANTITLTCQDKSKRLADHFIDTQYTIDYPSYTKYWISKFLDESGVDYNYLTPFPGNLISNNTVLGMMPAYEQILNLLQLSGWYMFFDGDGVAQIGNLTSDFSGVRATFDESNILNISKISNDKMLRNRAVVWGTFDYLRNEYAYADISITTKYNYDRRDKRAMVISNNNIPNKSSAILMANKLIKEFAKITVEKHLTVAGTPDVNLGQVVRLRSRAYNGTGLITTFGVSMSRTGLETNLILDERCPRLFGFFDFGDYVYVGTYGDGVWRKLIKYDPTWYDFSAGLTNLQITDLHINNEIFGSVASSGEMFYAESNDSSWVQYSIPSLTSTLHPQADGEIASGVSISGPAGMPTGSGVELIAFSGLMARAVIVDKLTNVLKYGIDTYSGLNMGDYFLTWSGAGIIQSGWVGTGISGSQPFGLMAWSGVMESGYRGWVVEYNPFDSASGVYPISVSGNFNVIVVDIENDGINDYVSIGLIGSGVTYRGDDAYTFGTHSTAPDYYTKDFNALTNYPYDPEYVNTSSGVMVRRTLVDSHYEYYKGAIYASDQVAEHNSVVVAVGHDAYVRKLDFYTEIDDYTNLENVRYDITTSATNPSMFFGDKVVAITADPYTPGIYTIYSRSNNFINSYIQRTVWNSISNTFDVLNVTVTASEWGQYTPGYPDVVSGPSEAFIQDLAINNTLYSMQVLAWNGGPSTQSNSSPTRLVIIMSKIDMLSGHGTVTKILDFNTEIGPYDLYHYFGEEASDEYHSGRSGGEGVFSATTTIRMYQNGTGVSIKGWMETVWRDFFHPDEHYVKEYLVSGTPDSLIINPIYDGTEVRFFGGAVGTIQLTSVDGYILGNGFKYWDTDNPSTNGFKYDGYNFVDIDGSSTPSGLSDPDLTSLTDPYTPPIVFPIYDMGNRYILYRAVSDTFWICDSKSLEALSQIVPPSGWILHKPFSNTLSKDGGSIYWVMTQEDDEGDITGFVPWNFGHFDTAAMLHPQGYSFDTRTVPGFNFGEFFISGPDVDDYYTDVTYINFAKIPNNLRWLLLQRDNYEFKIVDEGRYPIRVDISLSAPILDVQDTFSTFKSFFINTGEVSETDNPLTLSGMQWNVSDYRYTMLPGSGELDVQQVALFTSLSGLQGFNVTSMSGVEIDALIASSGFLYNIETTNYVPSGQYIFITTSGEYPEFWQHSPEDMGGFTSFSGLPMSRSTIIRIDDRF